MPSIHIAEDTFRKYVDQEGGYQEAKDRIKDVVERGIEEGDNE